MNDKEGGGPGRVSDISEMPNSNYGVKTTTHPLMLLIVKGLSVYTCIYTCTCIHVLKPI